MKHSMFTLFTFTAVSIAIAVIVYHDVGAQTKVAPIARSPAETLRFYLDTARRGESVGSLEATDSESEKPIAGEIMLDTGQVVSTPPADFSPRLDAFRKRVAGANVTVEIKRVIEYERQARVRIEIRDGERRLTKDVFMIFKDGWKLIDVAWPDEDPEFAPETSQPVITT